jgi:nucleoside-diphosphate kinase
MSKLERTFAIIKPDAVAAGNAGGVITKIEKSGFRILAMRKIHMTRAQAEGFYAVHRKRPFFKSLVKFMTSGPSIVMALERENAIAKWRQVMGSTNPAEAARGTVRKLYGTNIEQNASHGSDAPETAKTELGFFFSAADLL